MTELTGNPAGGRPLIFDGEIPARRSGSTTNVAGLNQRLGPLVFARPKPASSAKEKNVGEVLVTPQIAIGDLRARLAVSAIRSESVLPSKGGGLFCFQEIRRPNRN